VKKNQQIEKIIINDNHVSVYDTTGREVKITRTQRQIFRNYFHWNFLEKLSDEFGRDNILAPDYCVIENGQLVVNKE